MENVKNLVEEYCQITGRPSFTITVDEYIKFHQLASFQSPIRQEKVVTQVQAKEPVVETSTLPSKKEVEKEGGSFRKETSKSSPIREEKKVETKVQMETKNKPTAQKDSQQTALEMLKSIKG